MKRNLLYIIIIILVFIISIKIFFSYKPKTDIYQITYQGELKDKETLLFNTFSWTQTGHTYQILHQLLFQSNNTGLIDLTVQEIFNETEHTFILHNYYIHNPKGNYRLDKFGENILDQNINKQIQPTTTWLSYKTTTIPWVLQDTTNIEGSYKNQLDEINKIYINLQIYCGIGQYFKTTYQCDINGTIQAILPIKDNKKNITIKGILTKTRLYNTSTK